MDGDAVITGRLTAQEFHTELISSSILFDSGSTLFGNTMDDLHTFTGSIAITGSIAYPEYIDIDTTPGGGVDSTITGRISWNNGTRDLVIGAGNNVDIQLGQQEWAYVYNAESTTLNKGEIVYISGSQGNTIAVKRASNNAEQGSAQTLGMVGESIASGGEGLVLVNGLMKKLDTSTLVVGRLVYLAASAGTYTILPPTPPSHSVRVGYVAKVDATQGQIYVKIDNGYEIGELHDVIDNTTTSSYGDLLVKSGSVWINSKQLTGSYGVTGSLNILQPTGSEIPLNITRVTGSDTAVSVFTRQYASSSGGVIPGNTGFGIRNEFYGSLATYYPIAHGAVEYTVGNILDGATKRTDYIGGKFNFEKITEHNPTLIQEFSRLNTNYTHRKYIMNCTTTNQQNVYLAIPSGPPFAEYIDMPVQESWNFTVRVIARKTDANGFASDAFFINGYCDNNGVGTIVGLAAPLQEVGSAFLAPGLNVAIEFDQNGGANNYFRVLAQSNVPNSTIQWVGYVDIVANYYSASSAQRYGQQ